MKKLKIALLIIIGCTMFSCHSRFELKSDKHHVRKAIYKDSINEDLEGYKFLDLKRSGKYSNYLGKVGERDAYYSSVKESLEAAGGITPNIVASFLKMHNELDFCIPKNRLWAAVFMLSIEEPHDKKMERYLNQK